MINFNNLSPIQYQAVTSQASAIRIIAGAGSGKTRVLTSRIAYLINHLGIDPKHILAITFTNKATIEMKERLIKMLNEVKDLNVSTIHSLCVQILRRDIKALGYPNDFIIIDTTDQQSILKNIYRNLQIAKNEYPYSYILNYISQNKCQKVTPEMALNSASNTQEENINATIYYRYQQYLDKNYMLDFDDLILKVNVLFQTSPTSLEKYSRLFQYVLVDEFQDIDDNQYELIKYLTSYHKQVCVVGDPDQTIYTWRGANASIILDFERDFKNVETIILNENFRSTKNILGCANSVIKYNKNRIDKDLYTQKEAGEKVVLRCFRSDEMEANYVVSRIIELKKYYSTDEIAILYRANYQSRALEKVFIENKLSYRIYGAIRFYERAEIKDMLAYLRMCVSADDLSLIRTINNPKRGIGEKTLLHFIEKASAHNLTIFEYLESNINNLKDNIRSYVNLIKNLRASYNTMDIDQFLNFVFNETGYYKMLVQQNEEERIENVRELFSDIQNYFRDNPECDLNQYLQMIILYTDKINSDNNQDITLMTIHSAKGLEYDVVFLVGMNEGVFPSERSLQGGYKALEEERRLAYVAFTRAKQILEISYTNDYSYITQDFKQPSRFISEISEEYIRDPKANKEKVSDKNVGFSNTKVPKKSYKKNDKVVHVSFGVGRVINVSDGILTIAFEYPYGIKKIVENHNSLKKEV